MTKFEKVARIDDAIEVTTTLAPDGRVATLLFTNLETRIGGTHFALRSGTRLCSLSLPVSDDAPAQRVKQDVRGHASRGEGERAILLASLSGTTLLHEFADSEEQEFLLTIESTIPAGEPYRATILLLVEPAPVGKGSSALLVLDSIEVNMIPD